jgi:hypothetical protein
MFLDSRREDKRFWTDMRNAYKILVEKVEGKRPFWRPWHRWKQIVK